MQAEDPLFRLRNYDDKPEPKSSLNVPQSTSTGNSLKRRKDVASEYPLTGIPVRPRREASNTASNGAIKANAVKEGQAILEPNPFGIDLHEMVSDMPIDLDPDRGQLSHTSVWASLENRDDSLDSTVDKNDYQGLRRPELQLFDLNTTAPPETRDERKWPKYVEKKSCAYMNWPLYNQYHHIEGRSQVTWPPANVLLQDWHIAAILKAKIGVKTVREKWKADFDSNGHLITNRTPRGRAAKAQDENGTWFYEVTCTNYQLSGDEGIRRDDGPQSWMVGPLRGALKTGKRSDLERGQICEIQEDFKPTKAEIIFGTLEKRRPDQKLPPLEERRDENRDPDGVSITNPKPSLRRERQELLDRLTILEVEIEDEEAKEAGNDVAGTPGKSTSSNLALLHAPFVVL